MQEQTVSIEEAMHLVTAHMKNEDYRVAELVLEDILRAFPDDHDALYMLALCRYFTGDIKTALVHIEKAVAGEDTPAEWWCNFGIMLTHTGDFEKAEHAYDQAIETDPDYGQSYWNKSHMLWLQGHYEEAEKAARVGIKMNPDIPESWLNLGTALVKLDRKDEAIEAWEKAVKVNPEFAPAWNNLGNVLRENGQLEAAIEKCRKALEINPNYAEAQSNLANALMDSGEIDESEALYRQAISNKPDYVEARNNLAVNLIKQNRFHKAIEEARLALSYRPDYFDALLALSLACRYVGQIEEAERAIHKATIIRPDSAEARIDLADLLFMQDRYAAAEVELERAKQLKPNTPQLYFKLAHVLERGNKIEEALEVIDKAVELNPQMPDAYLKKGGIYHVSNRIEEARESFDKALELMPNSVGTMLAISELCLTTDDREKAEEYVERAKELAPNTPSLYLTLSKIKKFKEDDPDFQKMLELQDKAEQYGVDQETSLQFALYRAYEQMGDDEKCFEHLLKANTLKRSMVPYDAERQKDIFQSLKTMYSPENLKQFEGRGFESELPVFIVGMPRSGTTLTEQIISSHADVYGAGELVEVTMMDITFGALTPDNARAHGEWYIEQVRKRDKGGSAMRITDKMPGNFSALGKITSVLPQARIIHTRRNPIDTCLSCFKQNFARGQYWSYDMKELGEFYNAYLDLMAYWRDVIGDKFIEVDYEDTVNNLEPQARKLIEYVDLQWDDACLEPHKQKRAVLTASKQQVTKPVYKTSVKAWKKYEKQLAPLIDELQSGPAKDLLDL